MHRTQLRREFVLAVALVVLGPAPAAGAEPSRDRATPIVVHVDSGGFRWTDAGIGALAGVGGTLAFVGGAALVRSAGPDITTRKE